MKNVVFISRQKEITSMAKGVYKKFVIVIFLAVLSACTVSQPKLKGNIKNVQVLFKDTTWYHPEGYKLYDGSLIRWDKKNIAVKVALNKYRDKLGLLKKEGPDYLERFITKKSIKYVPIKVVPLKEFGYIETTSNQHVFYGIMGDKTFIDLSNDRVYISEATDK